MTDSLESDLRQTIETLAVEIGVRTIWHPGTLAAAEDFIATRLRSAGYTLEKESFTARGTPVVNLWGERRGTKYPDEIIVVGAHYDSRTGMARIKGRVPDPDRPGTPGANDNASGVAAMLALADAFQHLETERTIRFIAFVNEEPPFFQTEEMGSWVHAHRCRERGEKIVGMFTPETLGYYTEEPGTQKLAWFFGRDTGCAGDFLALLSNWSSRHFLRAMVASFRARTRFPVVGVPVPRFARGVAWSDDWGFWQAGYSGVTVTDTAFLRYRHYHTPQDTPDKLTYPEMTAVVDTLIGVLSDLDRDRTLPVR